VSVRALGLWAPRPRRDPVRIGRRGRRHDHRRCDLWHRRGICASRPGLVKVGRCGGTSGRGPPWPRRRDLGLARLGLLWAGRGKIANGRSSQRCWSATLDNHEAFAWPREAPIAVNFCAGCVDPVDHHGNAKVTWNSNDGLTIRAGSTGDAEGSADGCCQAQDPERAWNHEAQPRLAPKRTLGALSWID